MTFTTGHLANGGAVRLGRDRLRGPCNLCKRLFVGNHNQMLCKPCAGSAEGGRFVKERHLRLKKQAARRATE